ncbi:MAG: cation:proton antiporter [Candidatus Eremiobacteraeota bacterium]|nr:cation:proton antiporter [Candidatus Eremiobacteraeota bacterium]
MPNDIWESLGVYEHGLDILLIIGLMIALGYLGKVLSERFNFPHVMGYIVIGLILGRSVLNIINPQIYHHIEILSIFALAMVGFSIGGELRYSEIKELGKTIPVITIFESTMAFLFVFVGIFLFTHKLSYGLIFGSLAAATAPAATVNVLWQYNARGPLTTTIFSVVGLDDAMALILFAFASSFARTLLMHQKEFHLGFMLLLPIIEILGSLAIGAIIALLVNQIMKTLQKRVDILMISLGAVLLCAGIARTLGLSLILTSMALGVVLANVSKKNRAAFDVLHRFTPPFYVLLFVIVGSHVDISILPQMGLLGILYIIFRIAGKLLGAWTGATISKAKENVRKYLGFGLLSQAGVAIGLAIEASHSFRNISPEGEHLATLVMSVIAATVFVFEIIGPYFAKYAIFKAGEVDKRFLTKKN